MELTRNGQVIQRHTMEARIHSPLLVPPSKSISDMLGIGAEITIQLITKVGFGGGRKCRQLIEDVFERGRRTLKEKLARHFEVCKKIRTVVCGDSESGSSTSTSINAYV